MDDSSTRRNFSKPGRKQKPRKTGRRGGASRRIRRKTSCSFFSSTRPLKPWQRDVLWIIRDEAYYFAPQAQTKIMNEGWATYWHAPS